MCKLCTMSPFSHPPFFKGSTGKNLAHTWSWSAITIKLPMRSTLHSATCIHVDVATCTCGTLTKVCFHPRCLWPWRPRLPYVITRMTNDLLQWPIYGYSGGQLQLTFQTSPSCRLSCSSLGCPLPSWTAEAVRIRHSPPCFCISLLASWLLHIRKLTTFLPDGRDQVQGGFKGRTFDWWRNLVVYIWNAVNFPHTYSVESACKAPYHTVLLFLIAWQGETKR